MLLGFVISCLVASDSWLSTANEWGEFKHPCDLSGFSQASGLWETALINQMGWFDLISPCSEEHADITDQSADRAKPLQTQSVMNSKQEGYTLVGAGVFFSAEMEELMCSFLSLVSSEAKLEQSPCCTSKRTNSPALCLESSPQCYVGSPAPCRTGLH